MCELSEPEKNGKMRTTPSFGLAMLTVDFVGVVRGFAVSPRKTERRAERSKFF